MSALALGSTLRTALRTSRDTMADPTRSMTYSEIGEALSIKPASAAKLSKRKGWQRTPGNDGRTRVAVPLEALRNRNDTPDKGEGLPDDMPRDVRGDVQAQADVLRLSVEVARLGAQLEAAERRAADLEADRDRWHQLATARPQEALKVRLSRLLSRT